MCGNAPSSRGHGQDDVFSRSQGVDAAAAGNLDIGSGLIWSDNLILDDDAAAAAAYEVVCVFYVTRAGFGRLGFQTCVRWEIFLGSFFSV